MSNVKIQFTSSLKGMWPLTLQAHKIITVKHDTPNIANEIQGYSALSNLQVLKGNKPLLVVYKVKNIPSYFSLQEISFGDGKEVVLTDVFVLQIHLGHKHVSHQWMAIYTSHYIMCHIWLPFEPQHPSWYSWNKYVYKL